MSAADNMHKSEVRDGMRIDWDVPIPMNDGTVLRADVFRPAGDGRYPVLMYHGPYAKGLAFQDQPFRHAWDKMIRDFPEVARGTTAKYMNWESVDPEKWVPDGYVCLRVDSRGAGRSPGYLNIYSPRETDDYYACIEWAARQPWSNGKVGLHGISYYATNQWQVASRQPPSLTAMCVWEGAADFYRDLYRHGGIVNAMILKWYPRQVVGVQHGKGERAYRSYVTGELVSGPETLPEEELARNRADTEAEILAHPLEDEFYTVRSPRFDRITVPLLSSANWGGAGLHPRGNFEGYVRSATQQKWLEAHGDSHYSPFYTDHGVALQKRFFGHFLKGEDTGWKEQPPVELQVRHPGEKFVLRHENEWPIARTQWTRFYLDPNDKGLRTTPAAADTALTFEAMGAGALFLTPPMETETEITGPVAAKLFVSSDTSDADLFLVLRVFDPAGKEVTFQGAVDPRTPVAQGWLRCSQRKLDPALTLPYRPYHAHDERWPLVPGEPVEVEVEIWPTCIVVPAGYRIGLHVRGKDYENDDPPLIVPGSPYAFTGVGGFTHDNPVDRPSTVFAGNTTLHFDAGRQPYLLLPLIPSKD